MFFEVELWELYEVKSLFSFQGGEWIYCLLGVFKKGWVIIYYFYQERDLRIVYF